MACAYFLMLGLLAELVESNARLGILTRNSRANALETLAVCNLDGFFVTC